VIFFFPLGQSAQSHLIKVVFMHKNLDFLGRFFQLAGRAIGQQRRPTQWTQSGWWLPMEILSRNSSAQGVVAMININSIVLLADDVNGKQGEGMGRKEERMREYNVGGLIHHIFY
jgi:hypothetical protein